MKYFTFSENLKILTVYHTELYYTNRYDQTGF